MKYRGTKPAFHDVRHLHNDEELVVESGKNEGVKNRQIRKYLKSTGHKGKSLRKSMHTIRKEGLDKLIETGSSAAMSLSGPDSPVKLSQEQMDKLYPSTANPVKREALSKFSDDERHEASRDVISALQAEKALHDAKTKDKTIATQDNEEDND